MSESQSRYSIVERLTQKKLDIITEDLEIKEDIKKIEQKIERLKKDLAEWENDVQQDNERSKIMKEREIEKSEIFLENSIKRKVAKEESLKDKIKAVDNALGRIEEISKTSPTTQQS